VAGESGVDREADRPTAKLAGEDAADRGAPVRELALAAAGRHRRSHEGFYER
jgi:hypothetical protein